jgi:hypothetical protein
MRSYCFIQFLFSRWKEFSDGGGDDGTASESLGAAELYT